MSIEDEEGSSASWWDKLRRRKVVQWGIAYVAGAWGLLQGLAYLRETFDWPQPVQQTATLLLLCGLPIALVIAWYHGDRGHQRVTRAELAVLTALFLTGGVLFWRHMGVTEIDPGAATTAVATEDARPSIAVLPFENRSAEDDDAHFVDGIHDDILTQLSKISALKVISRTSVERFRDTRLPLKEIAAQLGVTSVLEGGVQRAGDRVRINVQLIDARTDAHLWSESYDRELAVTDIFAIQSDVAHSIARALRAALTDGERASVAAIPTSSLEAWEVYQIGRQRLAKRSSESLAEAEAFFARAIALDPDFALAYAGLSDAIVLQATYGSLPLDVLRSRAEQAVATARRLAPDESDVLKSAAYLAYNRQEYREAEDLFRRAIAANPNNAQARHWYSVTLLDTGRLDEAAEECSKALELDPLFPVAIELLGAIHSTAGRFGEAEAQYRRAIMVDPTRPGPYSLLGYLYAYALNRFADAAAMLEQATLRDPGSPGFAVGPAMLALDIGDDLDASNRLAAVLGRWPGHDYANIVAAIARLLSGDEAGARPYLDQATATNRSLPLSRILRAEQEARHGNFRGALDQFRAARPELVGEAPPRVDGQNFLSAISAAAILQKLDDRRRATELLDGAERVIGRMQRLDSVGFGTADVQIHALRGEKAKALQLLQQAVDEGWRGPNWRYTRDLDPTLESIRGEPAFQAAFAVLEQDIDRQRRELAGRATSAP